MTLCHNNKWVDAQEQKMNGASYSKAVALEKV